MLSIYNLGSGSTGSGSFQSAGGFNAQSANEQIISLGDDFGKY